MDNRTLFDVKNAVEVMSKALKLFAEKITELMNWYHINQDTINEYLKAFGNLILWRNAVNRLSENQIVVSAQDIDFSTSAEESISCSYSGDSMGIGFKSVYLIEILNNISSQEVSIELSDPSRAGLILPIENQANEDLLMLLMPMMLTDF